MVTSKGKMDFTTGKIFLKFIWFTLPIILTNLLQVVYNIADMMVVSLSPEKNAVGAIGTTSSFVHLVTNLCIGVAVGANVVLARHIGAQDSVRAEKTVHTSVWLAGILGVICMAIGLAVSYPVLSLMGNRGDVLRLATVYAMVYFAGVPFLLLTNFLSAIFRAKGNAKLPLVVLSLSGIVNVVLNLFFVVIVGWSVEGVALATAISNVLSAVILAWKLTKETDETKLCFKKLKLDKQECKEMLYIGLPAGLQSALFSLSNMLIQSSVVRVNNSVLTEMYGGAFPPDVYQPVVSGNASAQNLETFVYTSMNAVYQSAITVTSQNVGAKKPERLRNVVRCAFVSTLIVALVMGGILFALKKPLLSMYGVVEGAEGSLEAVAMQTALTRLYFICIPYALAGWMEDWSGMLRGLGKSMVSTVISIFGAIIFRIVWIFTVFQAYPTLQSIFISYPISWILTGVIAHIAVQIYIRKFKKQCENEVTKQEENGRENNIGKDDRAVQED